MLLWRTTAVTEIHCNKKNGWPFEIPETSLHIACVEWFKFFDIWINWRRCWEKELRRDSTDKWSCPNFLPNESLDREYVLLGQSDLWRQKGMALLLYTREIRSKPTILKTNNSRPESVLNSETAWEEQYHLCTANDSLGWKITEFYLQDTLHPT